MNEDIEEMIRDIDNNQCSHKNKYYCNICESRIYCEIL